MMMMMRVMMMMRYSAAPAIIKNPEETTTASAPRPCHYDLGVFQIVSIIIIITSTSSMPSTILPLA